MAERFILMQYAPSLTDRVVSDVCRMPTMTLDGGNVFLIFFSQDTLSCLFVKSKRRYLLASTDAHSLLYKRSLVSLHHVEHRLHRKIGIAFAYPYSLSWR